MKKVLSAVAFMLLLTLPSLSGASAATHSPARQQAVSTATRVFDSENPFLQKQELKHIDNALARFERKYKNTARCYVGRTMASQEILYALLFGGRGNGSNFICCISNENGGRIMIQVARRNGIGNPPLVAMQYVGRNKISDTMYDLMVALYHNDFD
ncbi:MAG: hypothetical protein HGA31_04445 [Candidatus Moranbacteria bacterium]|nr:hypothetical protein [Candidatus Moranbacteria bacterium]